MSVADRVEGARRLVLIVIVLAVVVVLTGLWMMLARVGAAWVLCVEGVAIVVVAMLIRSDLRDAPRHRVK
jgi:sugar phosphate permease